MVALWPRHVAGIGVLVHDALAHRQDRIDHGDVDELTLAGLGGARIAETMPTAHMVAGIRSPMPGPTFMGVSLSGPVIAITPPKACATTS